MYEHARSTQLTTQLDREWGRLVARRHSCVQIRSCRSGDITLDDRIHHRLATIDHLGAVLALTHRDHGADADELLHWLLVVGREEPVAWRIVLQRILPLLISNVMATARSGAAGPGATIGTAVDDTIAAASVVFAEYADPAGRPHVAPRLADRALYHGVRKARRVVSCEREVVTENRLLDVVDETARSADPVTVAARLLRAATRAGVATETIDLGRRLARGDSTASIAAARGCHERTIRNHRRRAIAELRDRFEHLDRDWSDPLVVLDLELGDRDHLLGAAA